MQITPHFSSEELACHDGTPYPLEQFDEDRSDGKAWGETRALVLCLLLEAIREEASDEVVRLGLGPSKPEGYALIVDSAYRSPSYDERIYQHHIATVGNDGAVAPASRSQHPKGRASDVRHTVLSPEQLHAMILRLHKQGALPTLGGLGIYPKFVHVDVRPKPHDGHLAQWSGTRDSNQLAA
jgi:hypothetical protein